MPQLPAPASVPDALAQLNSALGYLAGEDWASLPAGMQRDAVAGFERTEARQVAARTRS
jgi:hypothetical protein